MSRKTRYQPLDFQIKFTDLSTANQRITELEAQLDHYRYCLKDIDLMEWASLLKEWKDRVKTLEAQLDSQNDDLVLLNDENYCHRFRIEQLEKGAREVLVEWDKKEIVWEDFQLFQDSLERLRKLVTP